MLGVLAVVTLSATALPSLESGGTAPSRPAPLIPPEVREKTLKEVTTSLRRGRTDFEWYTPRAEKVFEKVLQNELRSALDSDGSPPQRRRHGETIDLEALWVLCRSCMGGIEAALIELGKAYSRVERVRGEWHRVHAGSLSLVANQKVAKVVRLGSKVPLRLSARWRHDVSADESADVSKASSKDRHDSTDSRVDDTQPLGSDRTRLGLGIRRRALLRSEAALACHAGALHDLRVLLRDAGGEWLELGRWVGGPPLSSMPWDAQPCASQQEHLLEACSRVVEQIEQTAAALKAHGPFGLYCSPFPRGAHPSLAVRRLEPTRPVLVGATRQLLIALRAVRSAARHAMPPSELVPPNALQRHSLVYAGALLLLSYCWCSEHWRSLVLAARSEGLRHARKGMLDMRRFWHTHLTEPLQAIMTEFFKGHQPTIDPAQVQETRRSLVRMLQDYVRDTHRPSDGEEALAAALERAKTGSMEAVTSAYEQQVGSPVSSLLNGQLLRSLLLLVQQLRLLMEEEVEAVDSLLRRNDFNLQVMATVPALALSVGLLLVLRSAWRRFRGADSARRDPIEAIQAQVIAIDTILTRAEGTRRSADSRQPAYQRGELSQFEASPMALSEVGELVFRVQRLRAAGSHWLRGVVRNELLHDAHALLDSGRLSAMQRSRVAQTLLRRLDSLEWSRDHW